MTHETGVSKGIPEWTQVPVELKIIAESEPIRTYIAGPMRGVDGFNHDAFAAVAKLLRGRGGYVFNPAENFGGAKDRAYSEYMRVDLQQVIKATDMCLLPGWEKSEGARLEVSVGRALGLRFHRAWFDSDNIAGSADWAVRSMAEDEFKAATEGIDQEARRLVYGERAQTYGHPRGDFMRIAHIWEAILDVDITEEQVALMMAGLKIARLISTPDHRDSQVDTIGYMLCLSRLQESEAEIAAWESRESS